VGILTGSKKFGIGVSPDSKWIAARGCTSFSCTPADIIKSAEWVLCPKRRDGSGQDCSKSPRIISNSWGGSGTDWIIDILRAWFFAGKIVLFPPGKSGPACYSIDKIAASSIVFSAAATNKSDTVADFSSRGPLNFTNMFKPDLAAPGVDIKSASHVADTYYTSLSSTFISTHHLAGSFGLYLSKNPEKKI